MIKIGLYKYLFLVFVTYSNSNGKTNKIYHKYTLQKSIIENLDKISTSTLTIVSSFKGFSRNSIREQSLLPFLLILIFPTSLFRFLGNHLEYTFFLIQFKYQLKAQVTLVTLTPNNMVFC